MRFRNQRRLPLAASAALRLAAVLMILGLAAPALAEVKASRGQITLPTYPWAAVRHPYFRGTDGVNIYPYPMLDFLSRDKTDRTYRTVVLENEYLRITFLPELGGKIHEVIDKTTGLPMFYVNHVVKPGLIGQCGAWTSGGVEWNTGPQGHTVGCMVPVAVEILPQEKDGARSVAIGETERIYRTKWTVVVTLRPGRSFIEERIRIYNPTETIRPYYFWNCTAVPNTAGFRFVYPMTLGTDHGSEKFFNWPIDHGKDLTRGTNYQDASSIFAWHCDQDFFGSYDDLADHGVVSFANHHQVPGKKAWTWGQGGFGKMHQMDLTDADGPYNEVQTGPLLTQGEVGRLDPCEAVEWQEWWYPVHGINGFTFANKDVAVNASREGTNVILRIMGTAEKEPIEARVSAAGNPRDLLASASGRISPARPAVLRLGLPASAPAGDSPRLVVELRHRGERLAQFSLPLDLPRREPPSRKPPGDTAAELVQAGWQDFLFAKFTAAEAHFRKALDKDPACDGALTGLALLKLDSDPSLAAESARSAVAVAPHSGLPRLALAVAEYRFGNASAALDDAWKAALDPATATAARALVAKLQTRSAGYRQAADAVAQPGPWQTDPLCRNRLAFALLKLGDKRGAVQLAQENLAVDPLDTFACSIFWKAQAGSPGPTLGQLLDDNPQALLDLAAEDSELLGDDWKPVHQLLEAFCVKTGKARDPITSLWLARGCERYGQWSLLANLRQGISATPADGVFPYRPETLPLLQDALQRDPNDGKAALYLGHVLFHLGRHAEGRRMWRMAAARGAEPVIAYRALGMASKTLDNDLDSAREWLERANQADPQDAIVARDLAGVLFALAEKTSSEAEKRSLTTEARDRLKTAFPGGKGRSDYVALLARAQNRLGDYAETARMLDSVRVTVWEGAHEVHDLFENAHLALGEAQLKAGHPVEALVEFQRALEYPENLATGKLENAREARIQCLRGNAFLALGQKDKAVEAWRKAADEPASNDEKQEAARKKAREALDKAVK